MKKFFKIFMIVFFVLLLIGTFVFLWSKTRPVKVVYNTVQPAVDTIEKRVVATGKVEARDEVLIKPQISGIVSDIYFEAGQMVRQGDVIARVKVIPEMGALNSAQSRLTLANISMGQVQTDFNRTQQLYDSGVISLEEYEKAKSDFARVKEELQNAKDNLEIVEKGASSRMSGASNTQIRSTINGMILDIPIKVGNSVIQSNTFNDGTTIASIADLGDMIFRGQIDEAEVGRLKEGMPMALTIGALQGVNLDAVLEYLSPKGVESNGVVLFEMKAAVKIPAGVFVRAGYSANASIVTDSRQGVLTIPESVVAFEDEKPCVYALTSKPEAEEQVFEKKEVTLGLSDGVNVEVLSGVEEGDNLRGSQKSGK